MNERKEKNMNAERKIVKEQWFLWGEVNRSRSQKCARSFASINEAHATMARLGMENPETRYFLSRTGEERQSQ